MQRITVETDKEKEIVDITDKISRIVKVSEIKTGFAHLFLAHTTAALTTAYLDPEEELEIFDLFEVAVPSRISLRNPHEHTHRLTRMPDHFLASFLGPSLSIPIENSNILLGEFQRLVLVELNGPRSRQIIVGCTQELTVEKV